MDDPKHPILNAGYLAKAHEKEAALLGRPLTDREKRGVIERVRAEAEDEMEDREALGPAP